eukprot:TRINITY_DN1225_c1_g1_i10.p1 TRINITY_DN1225_c1_g1~~TRINITY_DN1225_c1_g1_i10.p1  ORF type:complete len:345 (-),score=27.94 TRINITY_DN1225_c1_g1_i10:1255-2289(-)
MTHNLSNLNSHSGFVKSQKLSWNVGGVKPHKVVFNAAVDQSPIQLKRQPRFENVSGDFYVDHTCIDCDTCRWMAPNIFERVNDQSAVVKQPTSEKARNRTIQALVACPTHSVHMKQQHPKELYQERMEFPILVEGCQGIYHTGYHAANTYGCASWLIIRQNGGPIMFDVPRFDPHLVKKIEQMGGIQYIIMSHKDDIGDHDKWANHFGAKRIIHKTELGYNIFDAEILLEGEGPWLVDDQEDLQMIHVPGHTEGSIVLYHPKERVIFTGDHFAMSGWSGELSIFERFNQYSIDLQLASVDKISELDVKWILPGHGRPTPFQNKQDYKSQLQQFLQKQGYQKQNA